MSYELSGQSLAAHFLCLCANGERHADFWFRLLDIRRIISDATPAALKSQTRTRRADAPIRI